MKDTKITNVSMSGQRDMRGARSAHGTKSRAIKRMKKDNIDGLDVYEDNASLRK